MRTVLSILTLVAVVLVGAAGSAAASTPACGDLYRETPWDLVQDGPVRIETSLVSDALAERYRTEINTASAWVISEIGPVDVTICLVDEAAPFDRERYRQGSIQFHAVSDIEDRFITMDTRRQIKFVAPAMAFAIPSHALFQNNGGIPFPEPLASSIAYWYRARMIEHLPYHERAQRGANLFETEAQIDWTAGEQPMFQSWDPDGNDVSISAFIDFAVRGYGSDILLETDGEVWSEIESEWRTAQRIELTGSATPSTGWRGGAVLVITLVVIGALMAGYGIYRARRKRPRPDTPEPIPGFFERDPEITSDV